MKTISQSIRQFFYAPVNLSTLGYFRIAVGLFALIQSAILLPDWLWLYGPKGILPWDISDALSTKHTPGLSQVANFFSYIHISSATTLYIVTIIYFTALISLTIGYKTKPAAVLAFLAHLILNTTAHFTAYGVETFTNIALFYCVALPVGITLSVDAYKKQITISSYLITLSVRILQLHLCIMYMASGIEKAMGYQWWNGEAIWIAMQQDQFHHVNIDWMASIPIVPKILCLGTLVIETLYPLGMLWRKTGKYWLAAIVSMHLGIALFLGLQLFGTLMIILNVTAFGQYCFQKKITYGLHFSFVKKLFNKSFIKQLQ